MPRHAQPKVLASNRKARHEYEILETFEAGIVLQGTEVKSVREGKVQLKDGWVDVRDDEAWLVGVHISPFAQGNRFNHDPERPRKLLLHRRQIDKLFGRGIVKGDTVIPLSIYLKGNLIKVEIALARGKKLWDKRETERRKVMDREAEEAIRERRW